MIHIYVENKNDYTSSWETGKTMMVLGMRTSRIREISSLGGWGMYTRKRKEWEEKRSEVFQRVNVMQKGILISQHSDMKHEVKHIRKKTKIERRKHWERKLRNQETAKGNKRWSDEDKKWKWRKVESWSRGSKYRKFPKSLIWTAQPEQHAKTQKEEFWERQ